MFLLLVLDWPTVRGVTFDVLFVVFKVHLRLRSASRGCATSGLFHEVGRSERQKKAGRWFQGSGAVGMSGGDLATRAPTLGPHRGSRADPETVAVLAWKIIVVSQPCTPAGRGSADFWCIRKWFRPNHVRAQPVHARFPGIVACLLS